MLPRYWTLLIVLLALTVNAAIDAPTNFRSDPADFSDVGAGNSISNYIAYQFRWTDNADNETGYQVEVSTNGVDFFLEKLLPQNTTGYDSAVVPWTSNRWYRIRAVNTTEQSTYAGPWKAYGYMPPTNLGGSTADTTHMTITWATAGGLIDGYTVEQDTTTNFTGANLRQYFVTGIDSTSYNINFAFALNTIYYFRAVSTNSAVGNGTSEAMNKPRLYIACAPNGPPVQPNFVSENTDATPGEAVILFDNVALNGTGFVLDWTTNATDWTTIPFTVQDAVRQAATHSGMVGGYAYSYRLAVTNSIGSSPYTTWTFTPPLTPAGSPTVWYVDGAATGNSTGTNWANAWTSLGAINWSVLGPDHVVYVSGGTYRGALVTYGSGAYAHPILIKTATNAPHNGTVTIGGVAYRSSYVTIDGTRDPSIATVRPEDVPNNINFRIVGDSSDGSCIATPAIAIGAVMRFAELTGAGSPVSGEGGGDALVTVPDSAGPTNCLFECLWIHDCYGSAINQSFRPAYNAPNGVVFSTMLIEDIHNNYGSVAGAFTISNCFFKSWKAPGVAHPDGFQGGFYNAKIVRTRVHYNCPSGSPFYPDMTGSTEMDNFYFINNTIYGNVLDMQASLTTAGTPLILSNWNFIGNTFYGSNQCSLSLVTSGTSGRNLKAWHILNNLFYTGTNGTVGAGGFSSGGTKYDPEDLQFDYNIICGPSKILGYRTNNTVGDAGVFAFPNAEAFNAWSSSCKSNSSISAQLLREYLLSLELYGGDTNAIDRGTNLTSWAAAVPEIASDVLGSVRGQGSGWDIGAYEHDPSLVLYFDFEGYTNGPGSIVQDMSGNANNGITVTNRTVTDVGNTNFAPDVVQGKVGANAANFMLLGTNEQWQVYHADLGYQIGNWFYVTNWNKIDRMTNFTVAFWICYTNAAYGDATIWGGGWINSPADDNTWDISRYDADNLTLTLFTNSSRLKPLAPPDPSVGVWQHLAYVGNCTNGTLAVYTNGIPYQTNIILMPYVKLSDSGSHNVAIGCSTHGGSMTLGSGYPVTPDDQFPNNGWFTGYLDELRIYNRDLSATEIYALANGSGAAVSGGGGAPPTPPANNQSTIHADRLTVGTVHFGP